MRIPILIVALDIVPARPRKPRDKAKVEVAVQVTTRWIIAKLRNIRFFSLVELNAAIRDCVTALNDRVSRHLGASRRALLDLTDSYLGARAKITHDAAARRLARFGRQVGFGPLSPAEIGKLGRNAGRKTLAAQLEKLAELPSPR